MRLYAILICLCRCLGALPKRAEVFQEELAPQPRRSANLGTTPSQSSASCPLMLRPTGAASFCKPHSACAPSHWLSTFL